jgi:hypothetical protein
MKAKKHIEKIDSHQIQMMPERKLDDSIPCCKDKYTNEMIQRMAGHADSSTTLGYIGGKDTFDKNLIVRNVIKREITIKKPMN